MSTLKYKNPNWVEGSGQPKWIVVGSGGSSGGNEAEIMAELQKLLDEKVEEAPMDGNQYVRTNGTWSVAQMAMSSKEKCTINLVSNQGEGDAASLYGATVKVTDVDSEEVYLDEVWDGTPFVLEFAGGVNYKIEVGDVADYATPEAKILTALEFNVRNLLFTYNTEVVSVTLSADNGASCEGQTITIGSYSAEFDGINPVIKKIAFGDKYNVSVNDKDGFLPVVTQNFTASVEQRNVSLVYKEIQYGVRIVTTDGEYIKAEDWDGGKTVNGIALITENVRFLIQEYDYKAQWDLIYGNDPYAVVSTESEALKDYDGQANTSLHTAGQNKTIFKYALEYTFPDGKTKGYIGSAGEMKALCDNWNEINAALKACGKYEFKDYNVQDGNMIYWTSTFGGKIEYENKAWAITPITKKLSLENVGVSKYSIILGKL